MRHEDLTTPYMMKKTLNTITDEMAEKFEKEFSKESKGENRYHLVIEGEYSREACDRIERVYKNVGWKEVVCKTSSENGERPGLTGLILSY